MWKGNRKPHDYTVLYDELFSKWRDSVVTILECGVHSGASLIGWFHYFREGVIAGMDINLSKCDPAIRLISYEIDQRDRAQVGEWFYQFSSEFEIIIDDGLHNPTGAIPFFTEAFPYLAKDGYYIVEDVKPKYLDETVAGMKAAHPQARITVHDRRYPGSKYDNILIIAEHGE